MIIRNKVGKFKINIILRYQGDKIDKEATNDFKKWSEKKLGIWWKGYTVKSFKNKKEGKQDDLAKGLMIGLNLIWANVWLDISKNIK